MRNGRSSPGQSPGSPGRSSVAAEVRSILDANLVDVERGEAAAEFLPRMDADAQRKIVILRRHPDLDPRVAVVEIGAPQVRFDVAERQLESFAFAAAERIGVDAALSTIGAAGSASMPGKGAAIGGAENIGGRSGRGCGRRNGGGAGAGV